MFDKILFDRNAFDRSVSSDGIILTMLGSSGVTFNLSLKSPANSTLGGSGLLASSIRMRQNIIEAFTGTGGMNDLTLIMRRSSAASLSAQGNLAANLIVRTPIKGDLGGSGEASIDSRMLMRQNLRKNLSGAGVFTPEPVFGTAIDGSMSGHGEISPRVTLWLPLKLAPGGQGSFTLRRLGALNENVIELIDINLLPGETITIDTDLLQVLIGSTEDVSSITTESVFFELNPGENEITVDVDSGSSMEITAIWQNRWL